MDYYNKYYLDRERVVEMIKSAIIVFDTSALLDLYYYSDNTKNTICTTVFDYLNGRMWVPGQVYFEFLKNREKVKNKPIQSYESLISSKTNDRGFVDKIQYIGSQLGESDIKKIQNGKLSLQEAIVSRTNIIKNDIARKQNALILLSEMLDDKVKFDTFETEHYWNIISSREAGGEEFVDIEDMYDYQSVSLIRDICCPNCGEENEVDLEDYMYDHSSYEKENGMGPDIVYSFDSEYNYCCPHCGASLQIEGWIREYPVGAYDSEEINICEIEKDE